jgi:hypothetical protein
MAIVIAQNRHNKGLTAKIFILNELVEINTEKRVICASVAANHPLLQAAAEISL